VSAPDLNLLVTLDVLLAEGSVARAARRLRLSPSAMSRALARLREVTGDPLLVRAGRGLVPSPRALEMRDRVARLVEESVAVLSPAKRLDPASLTRTFTLRTSDGFVENFGRDCSSASGPRRRACDCTSCRSPTRTAGRCATAAWISRPASSSRAWARSCEAGRCSAIVSSASCARGTRFHAGG